MPNNQPPVDPAGTRAPAAAGAGAANLEAWVDRHGDALYRYAVARVGDTHAAEDAVQETFLSLLRAPGSFAGRSAERTWLIGVLKHKIADYYRSQRRANPAGAISSPETSGDPADWAEGPDPTEPFFKLIPHWSKYPRRWVPDASALMEDREFWEVFERCRAALPPRLRQAFCLRVLDEEDPDKVCQELGVSATNFWVMLHRARTRLRRCLEAKWFKP